MARPFFTPAFEAYVVPARRAPQLWRLALGLVVVLVTSIGLLLLAWLVLDRTLGRLPTAFLMGQLANPVQPGPTLVVLATFAAIAVGTVLAVRLLHRRGPATLFGRAPRVIRDFAIAALAVLAVEGLATVVALPWTDLVPNLTPDLWLKLLPLSLAGLLLQTMTEEMLFRGYLMQSLAARFRWPLVWFVLPAALFGLAHYGPSINGTNTWAVVAATGLVGLAAADLTRVTGSLGAAWGLHFANNVLAVLFIATDGSITGLALWRTTTSASDPAMIMSLAADLGAVTLAWLLARRLTAR